MKKIILILVFIPTLTFAAKAPDVGGHVSGAEWLRMMIGLGFVIVVIFLLSWILKRVQTAGFASNSTIKLLTGLSLGGREKLMMVEVNGRFLLLGVAQGSVSLVYDFGTEKPESLERSQKSSFANIFNAAKGGKS
ncbi:flagellar biosynthetic protein FliO [Legionella sp. W05-934-2]|jgi:flagellar protein FliO/FliZ|uniref:flagellar biosynthetic protein FliO n=1 Tax=Legionella sp. W05-934-2 TaxID=1198649 RepID=UPI0034618262